MSPPPQQKKREDRQKTQSQRVNQLVMASDFDDIFGDLKEDEQFSATLPSDFDEASIFGDSTTSTATTSSSAYKPQEVGKPTAEPSADDAVAQRQELAPPPPAPVSEMAVAPASAATMASAPTSTATSSGKPLWEQIGNTEQDDFLSWLDDGTEPPPSDSASPPAPDSALEVESTAMDDISLDAPRSAVTAEPDPSENPPVPPVSEEAKESAVIAPPALPIHVAAPATAAVTQDSVGSSQILLDDDDDDDDDFLEKIVENAKKKAASNSRESSNSSLQIKSQSSSLQRVSVLDFEALYKEYSEAEVIPAASRLAMWHHAAQALLRKEVESLCGSIFSSKMYLEMVQSSAAEAQDTADGARLLFIDNAEILMTYLCKKLQIDNYTSGMALTFAPLITTSGNDPLRLELVETLLAVCHRVLPHLSKHLTTRTIATARRPLLKWLLLYHAPEIAFHLDQHFHTWNLSVSEAQSGKSPSSQNGVILDSWVVSMFESEKYHEFDFLMKVWDCCLLVGGSNSGSLTAREYTSTCMCFIVVHLIASRIGKKLLRMEGDQLRHCMGQTLVEALKDTGDKLTQEVQKLINATPPSFCSKLREVGYAPPPPSPQPATTATNPSEALLKKNSTSNLGMSSLISASATGVKELSSAMIDMPTKLLFMGSSSKTAATSFESTTKENPSQNAKQLLQDVSEAGESAAISMRLAASDVITQVFQSFQTPVADEKIRYFIIDCRSMDEQRDGQIPTAFHFDPDAVTDRQVLEQVLATLNPMKGKVHMCVMGHGYGHIADEIRQRQKTQQLQQQTSASAQTQQSPFELKDNFFEMYATNLTRVNSALLFLTKQGFPYVSVMDGGFAVAHGVLFHSTQFTVDDLIDHNASQCDFCQHHRSMAQSTPASGNGGAASSSTASFGSPAASTMSESKQESFSRNSTNSSSRGNSSANMPSAQKSPSSANGELDAKLLFDAHASNPGSSYFSGFAGAFKTTGKTFMNPADSLKDSTKWLMKKTNSNNSNGGDQQVKSWAPTSSPADRPSMTGGLPNFNKLRNSLAAMGSESLDLLKKAEQAAVAKTRVPFGASSSAMKAPSAAGASTAAAGTGAAASRTGSRSGASSTSTSATATQGDRNTSFQTSEEEVFTIDDDDEEDDFVGGGGGSSRTSSSSSARNESFGGNGGDPHLYPGSPAAGTATFTLHSVEKGHVNALAKGMHMSRVQMLPCVESPFFSGYKKKKLGDASGTPGRVSMLPRRLVIAENHIVVLKAERNMDDVYLVKSCHTLSHVVRMTCLKKNALMVTVYYKWKSSADGQVIEKRNSYEVQQRDEFIKAIKGAMEEM